MNRYSPTFHCLPLFLHQDNCCERFRSDIGESYVHSLVIYEDFWLSSYADGLIDEFGVRTKIMLHGRNVSPVSYF